jgi:hypothetical protein
MNIMDPLSFRVAARSLESKVGLSLVSEFQRIEKDYNDSEGKESKPLEVFINKVIDLALPGGKPPSWYHGLGTAKRNGIKFLVQKGREILSRLTASITFGVSEADLENRLKWRWWTVKDSLTKWSKHLRTLELASEAGDEERVIQVSGWKVIPMPGLTKAQVTEALESLDVATTKLRAVFPQVIYGDVYFSTHLARKVAAWYAYSEDKFYLSVNAKKRFDDVFTIVHELGHRFDDKFLRKDLKTRFWNLSTRKEYWKIPYDNDRREAVAVEILDAVIARKEGRPMSQLSDMAMLWIQTPYTPGYDVKKLTTAYLQGKLTDVEFVDKIMGNEDINVQTDKILHGPLVVSPYGASKPSENWADAFAMYVLGKPIPDELKEILDEAKK